MKRAVFELRKRIKKRQISQNSAAALVGADSGNFSKLLNEERGPSRSLAVAIEREFGVKVSWWDEEVAEEGPSVDPRAAGTGAEGR